MGTVALLFNKLVSAISWLLVTYSGFFIALPFMCLGGLLVGVLLWKLSPILKFFLKLIGLIVLAGFQILALALGFFLIIADSFSGHRLSPALELIGVSLYRNSERSRRETNDRSSGTNESKEKKASENRRSYSGDYKDKQDTDDTSNSRSEQEREWDAQFEKLRQEWFRRQGRGSSWENNEHKRWSHGTSGRSEQKRDERRRRDREESSSQRSSRSPLDDAYELLGITRSSGMRLARKQYVKLARQFHPDVNPNASEIERKRLEEKMKAINHAFDLVSAAYSKSDRAA